MLLLRALIVIVVGVGALFGSVPLQCAFTSEADQAEGDCIPILAGPIGGLAGYAAYRLTEPMTRTRVDPRVEAEISERKRRWNAED